MKHTLIITAAGIMIAMAGCQTQHKIEAETVHRVEVAPVHVTVDVNVRVQRELDELFSFEEEYK